MRSGHRIAVIIPAYNEQNFITAVLNRMPAFVDRILVVDDGSTDKTGERVLAVDRAGLALWRHERRLGVGRAVSTGLCWALKQDCSVVATLDADGQMAASDLEALVDACLEKNVDVVKGNRWKDRQVRVSMPPVRLAANFVLSFLQRWVTGYRYVEDSQCGYTAWKIPALKKIHPASLWPTFGVYNDLFARAYRRGLRLVNIPVKALYGEKKSHIRILRVIPGFIRLFWKQRRFFKLWRKRSGPRLWILSSSYPLGKSKSSAPFMGEYAGWLASRGKRVSVLCPQSPEPMDAEEMRWSRLEIRPVPYFWPRRLQLLAHRGGIPDNLRLNPLLGIQILPFMLSWLIATWVQVRPQDTLHAHWGLPSGIVAAWVKQRKKCRLIITFHSSDIWFLARRGWGRWLMRWMVNEAARVSVVSRDGYECVRRVVGQSLTNKIHLLPMGVSRPQLNPHRSERSPERATILYFGRLVPIKGVRYLLEALAGLPMDSRIWIAGEGPDRPMLDSLADELGVKAVFWGHVQGRERERVLEEADIVVFPSLVTEEGFREGVPVALLESMIRKKAVVATLSGGMGEIIRDGWNGLLCSPGDVQALREAVERLVQNKPFREQLAENARQTAGQYAWDNLKVDYDRLLAS